ncbi:metalloregulator ArsR/SmtB family transcription factor [Nocardia sp. CDC159]|uniref:Metalloregulator ArsR/SmtB family transcription factor n=1 Tax=Nocardia pulmonis TaxID=2951408 RepID=A0A9X2E6E7_9NOCA|nr:MULTISPECIES: metalloregulator ArsR/SmtB family transcription factor [Nocardia]MCM6772378.1 metalloregulator ArsR/SmtB family transcription factor [Nocardia pulmonis]MCM6784964.1 metalloregulator ArsR/SmtB family transcription factor [Nocardia sp. CDC159]
MSNPVPIGVAASVCAATPRTRSPLDAETATELAVMFKALSDPVRLRLLSAIASRAGQEACVCEVSDGLDVGQPTVSHHLKVLRQAGLLTSERRASWVYYRVVPEALQRLSDLLAAEAGSTVTA